MRLKRKAAVARLEVIRRKIEVGASLSGADRALLMKAISKAVAGEQYPFDLPLGKTDPKPRDLAIAQRVRHVVKSGEFANPSRSFPAVAAEFGLKDSDGGTVKKAWTKNKDTILGIEVLYQARRECRDMTEAESAAFYKAVQTLMKD